MHKHTLQLIIANLNAGGKAPDSFVLFKAGWNELADGLRYFDDFEGWYMGRNKYELSTAVPAAAPGIGYRDTAQPMPAISLSAKIRQKSRVRSGFCMAGVRSLQLPCKLRRQVSVIGARSNQGHRDFFIGQNTAQVKRSFVAAQRRSTYA